MFRIPRTCPCRPLPFRSPLILQRPDTRSHMFRIRYIYPCLQRQPNFSLHNNCFRRTDVDTCLAVNAHFLVDFCFFVLNSDCRSGTLVYTCLASCTFTLVNDCNQLVHSIVYVGEKIKNRFRCKHGEKTLHPVLFQWKAWKNTGQLKVVHNLVRSVFLKNPATDHRYQLENIINDIDESRVGLIWRITSRIFPFVMNAAAPEGTPPRRIS